MWLSLPSILLYLCCSEKRNDTHTDTCTYTENHRRQKGCQVTPNSLRSLSAHFPYCSLFPSHSFCFLSFFTSLLPICPFSFVWSIWSHYLLYLAHIVSINTCSDLILSPAVPVLLPFCMVKAVDEDCTLFFFLYLDWLHLISCIILSFMPDNEVEKTRGVGFPV